MFAILQKYDFSSKSQRVQTFERNVSSCLRYCKSTIFQANHNVTFLFPRPTLVVCDTAKVRFFKQITTPPQYISRSARLFAILQKYDFSSKSQLRSAHFSNDTCCLRYCKSTIFQANHNTLRVNTIDNAVVCDTTKVRFFKQITTAQLIFKAVQMLFAILQKYDFSSKSQHSFLD